MSNPVGSEQAGPVDSFEWHPTYRGRTGRDVRDALRDELAGDQRQYRLVIEAADQDEGSVLTTVVGLEKKWGRFDMDWSEADPDALADRVVAFEQERERRRELITYAAYRGDRPSQARAAGPAPDDVPATSRLPRYAWLLIVLVVIALILSTLAL